MPDKGFLEVLQHENHSHIMKDVYCKAHARQGVLGTTGTNCIRIQKGNSVMIMMCSLSIYMLCALLYNSYIIS